MAWPKYSSSFTTSSKTYRRPNQNQTTEATFYYEHFNFTVPLSQYYDIVCFSLIDTYGSIYQNSFDPVSPYTNLLKYDDDSNGAAQFKLNVHLQAGTKYTLVVTAYTPNVIGAFTIYTNATINK